MTPDGNYPVAQELYASMAYRRAGHSGVRLPVVSLDSWHNFGNGRPLEAQRAVLRRAFDLANNYGPPYGSAESNSGVVFARACRPYRDKLLLTLKLSCRRG
ncbi:aldo-keto reductase family protein [Streptomyces goshikiensis]|uniref:hypothetical protein n=1 Tax=Streptomyces goshikiensis TaxID=1942 RepID=UPI0036A89DC8